MDRNRFIGQLWIAKCRKLLSADQYLVGRSLLKWANKAAQLWPSQETIARDAGNCHVKTVQRAVARLEELGLLAKKRRPKTNRFRFASNLYTLCIPATLPPRKIRSCVDRSVDKSVDNSAQEREEILLEHSSDTLSAGELTPTQRVGLAELRVALGLVEPRLEA